MPSACMVRSAPTTPTLDILRPLPGTFARVAALLSAIMPTSPARLHRALSQQLCICCKSEKPRQLCWLVMLMVFAVFYTFSIWVSQSTPCGRERTTESKTTTMSNRSRVHQMSKTRRCRRLPRRRSPPAPRLSTLWTGSCLFVKKRVDNLEFHKCIYLHPGSIRIKLIAKSTERSRSLDVRVHGCCKWHPTTEVGH